MKPFAYPLIPITLFFSLGIVFASYFRINWIVVCACTSLVLLSLLFFFYYEKKAWRYKSYFGISLYTLCFLFGNVGYQFHLDTSDKKHYSHYLSDYNSPIFKAIIKEELKTTAKNKKYIVELRQIDTLKTKGKLLVYIDKKAEDSIYPGSEIAFNSKLISLPNNTNPFTFNYTNYLNNKNIFHEAFIKPNEIQVLGVCKNKDYYLYTIRKKLVNSFTIHQWNPIYLQFTQALLLGQRLHLDKEIIDSFTKVGVIHILAISGLHISILYFILLFISSPLEKLKYGNFFQAFLILSFLWIFAAITGFSASVVRAVTMFTLYTFATILKRDSSKYNTLALSALILLLFQPNLLFDIGFQLSYAAVLGIISFQPYFHFFHFTKKPVVKKAIDIILVSISAQIAVLPLTLYYFNSFPLLFLIANCVVIPIILLLLPILLIVQILNFILPSVAIVVGEIAHLIMNILFNFIKWLASYSDFNITNIPFNLELAVLLSVTIIAFHFTLKKKNFHSLKLLGYSFLIFQCYYVFILARQTKEEFIVFNSRNTLIAQNNNGIITAFTNTPDLNSELAMNYKRGSFSNHLKYNSLENVYIINNKKIVLIDSLAPKLTIQPDVLVLSKNPRINLERIITHYQPKTIVADNSNAFYLRTQWKTTCLKKRIPFHDTTEKGFFKLN